MNLSTHTSQLLLFRRSAPKRPRAKMAGGKPAPVIHLFAEDPPRRNRFASIRLIESVSIDREATVRLLVEGPVTPEYLEGLTCHFECPLMDIDTRSALRFSGREGDTVSMRTVMLRPQWNPTVMPSQRATIRIVDANGSMVQELLVPLLLAAKK